MSLKSIGKLFSQSKKTKKSEHEQDAEENAKYQENINHMIEMVQCYQNVKKANK